jgi:hypothetical protein
MVGAGELDEEPVEEELEPVEEDWAVSAALPPHPERLNRAAAQAAEETRRAAPRQEGRSVLI